MQLFRKHTSRITCPSCFTPIPLQKRGRFLGLFGERRVGSCPFCNQPLMWDPWGHGLFVGGGIGVGVLLIYAALARDPLISRDMFHILFVICTLTVVLGYMRLRLIPFGQGGVSQKKRQKSAKEKLPTSSK